MWTAVTTMRQKRWSLVDVDRRHHNEVETLVQNVHNFDFLEP